MVFPFDFGFFPGTQAADGDPLDALVLADVPILTGTIVECRLLGALRVATSDAGSAELVENDRIIAVPTQTVRGAGWTELEDVGEELFAAIGAFFKTYTEREGRRFELRGRATAQQAVELLAKATRQG